MVNLDDFNVLAANFGLAASQPGPASIEWVAVASAVPEPGATMCLLAIIPFLIRRSPAV